MILPMQNPLQDYAWGSRSFIQSFADLPHLIGLPLAEMWMGAHPKAPSMVSETGLDISLDKYIESHTAECLGEYGKLNNGQLPFLLKILAADEPLSIQAHPSKQQAIMGFMRESAMGIPIDASNRNYRDDNHKPELICALTDFTALCGFRPYQQIMANLHALGLDALLSQYPAFETTPSETTWKSLFRQILVSGKELCGVAESRFAETAKESDPVLARAVSLSMELAEKYPGDPGVLAPLYLNLITMQPFEALYLDAGVLHAYIRGAGIELMANSDNVLRGGLTPKHIDVQELCSILSYKGMSISPVLSTGTATGRMAYSVPASEFMLTIVALSGNDMDWDNSHHAPIIVLCLDGECAITDADGSIHLGKGNSAFITADTDRISISGNATLSIASCPA